MKLDKVYADLCGQKLAINGGEKIRKSPYPKRKALGLDEKEMIQAVLKYYDEKGEDPGYQGYFEGLYCESFCNFMGGGYADAVATGSGAVFIALAALNLPKGSDVLVSPITDPGTISAITMNGLVPRLVDSQPNSYNINVDTISSRLNNQTSAILVVHATGQAVQMEKIVTLARQHKIKIIEDCSQSHGAHIFGKPVGSFGDIAAFSTMYRKNHITGGSGGVVYTRDLDIFRQALAHADRGKPRWLENFDDRDPKLFLYPAMNWNTDEISCAIGLSSISKLPQTINRRLNFLSKLEEFLSEVDTIFSIQKWSPSDSPFILPIYVDESRSNAKKIDIAIALREEGVDLNPHYAYLVKDWHWIKNYLSDDFDTTEAKNARDKSFCLYLNENYQEQEAFDIVSAMIKVHHAFSTTKKLYPINRID